MSDAPTIIATISKNARESVRVALDQFHGIDLLDIRILAHADDGESDAILTKKGVAIRVGKIRELIEALQLAEAEARRRGLIAA
jgi:hypothetical protein